MLAALLVVYVACPLGVYLSLTASSFAPPKILTQPDPLPDDTRIYVPTWSQGPGGVNTILAVDGRIGASTWRSTLPTIPNVYLAPTWPPVAANGMLYLAQVTTWQAQSPSDDRSTIFALSSSDGSLVRTYTFDGAIDWVATSLGG